MIKRIFILEDNDHKLDDIVSCLKCHFTDDIRIDFCKYFNMGLRKIFKGTFDYVILDNTVPRFSDSSELVINAAELALCHMNWEEINSKTIICSSDEVKLTHEFDNCIGIVKYDCTSIDWKKELIALIQGKS